MNTRQIQIQSVRIGGGNPLVLIAGPCVIESESLVLKTAGRIGTICRRLAMPFIFKSSYTKANRSSVASFQGPGLEQGLRILDKVKREIGVPVLSDVHACVEVEAAAEVLDILQIPAHLCMQTALTVAMAKTGRPINVKKGQFLAPEDMKHVVRKIESADNHQILLTERGTSFGYHRLVVDMCALPIMRQTGYPVIMDATHAVRIYGVSSSDPSGGNPAFIPHLARAGVATGCDGVFIETHPRPSEALCDAVSMLPLDHLEGLLGQLQTIHEVVCSQGGE